MKTAFTLFFTFISFIAFSQAKIAVDHPDYNFGTFNEGADSTHIFTVKNIGNKPLIIISVTKPCGCTEPTFSQKPIMPGETGTVTVLYRSADHPGYFKKTLQIKTNDPKKDVYTISISGTVIAKKAKD